MKKTVFVLCCVLAAGNAFGESPYSLDLTKDLILGGSALGVFVPPLFIDGAPGPAAQRDAINGLDRSLMFPYDKTLDTLSTVGQYVVLALPALSLAGNITDTNVLLTYAVMYGEAFLLTYGTKDVLKLVVARDRPYTYFGDIPAGEEDDYFNSFPSGHTAFAFLGATFLSTTFAAEYPDSKWKIPVIAGSYTLAAGIAALRIASGNHFITDVLAGAAIGSLYGWLVPFLHLRRDSPVTVTPVVNGFVVSYTF
jgi:undecaprenyl-diphosphatase